MPVTSEINQLRMHKMLKKVGIDIDNFVDLFPPLKISQGVERCQSCDALDACDQHLDQAKVSVEDLRVGAHLLNDVHRKELEFLHELCQNDVLGTLKITSFTGLLE